VDWHTLLLRYSLADAMRPVASAQIHGLPIELSSFVGRREICSSDPVIWNVNVGERQVTTFGAPGSDSKCLGYRSRLLCRPCPCE
jgi:hypothetical protein